GHRHLVAGPRERFGFPADPAVVGDVAVYGNPEPQRRRPGHVVPPSAILCRSQARSSRPRWRAVMVPLSGERSRRWSSRVATGTNQPGLAASRVIRRRNVGSSRPSTWKPEAKWVYMM